jgi:NAD(P)-dependent dehydrogenase (short-subunit alcohol dehydrogenase family)
VAAAIAYLAADESAHVTGASIPVDGGYTAA